MYSNERIIVLCLDGASWEFIDPLLKENKLPNFERIIKNSFSASLKSTLPPTTIPAWFSMFSGQSPERLGISDFFVFDNTNFSWKIVNSSFIKGKMLWDLPWNRRFAVFNIPGTYPAYRFSGIAITDPPSLWTDKSFYPRDLKGEIEKYLGDKILSLKEKPLNRISRIKHLYKLTEVETDLFLYLYQNYRDIDVMIFRYEILDHIAHWAKNEEEIFRAYMLMDKQIGRILDKISSRGYMILVSDHGVQRKI